MLQKVESSQLQAMSLEDVEKYKQEALSRKAALEAAKEKGGKDWNPTFQNELNELAVFLVDIEEAIELKQYETEKEEQKADVAAYVPEKGTEKLVHLSIVHGRRFSETTGKEVSKPYVQKFTFAEWQLFKNNFKGLGYSIMTVLHDPYGEAKDYVVEK